MKTLFIVITDSGDGSQSLRYTFDESLILKMQDRQDELDDCYQSGDGLQVDRLLVPDNLSYEDLGIGRWSIQQDPFEEEDDEDRY